MFDHLGEAAKFKRLAKQAIKDKKFDDAWGYLHQQQDHYSGHIQNFPRSFTKEDKHCLLNTVEEDFANIHRLEGRHLDALASIICWIAPKIKCNRETKLMRSKLLSYYKRCKFKGTPFREVEQLVSENSNLIQVKATIKTWY